MSTTSIYFTLILVAIAANGAIAQNMINVCPREMVKLICPNLKQAIQRDDYKEVFWKISDPRDKRKTEQNLAYCNENLACTKYNSLGIFEKRIKIRGDPLKGVLYVEHMIKDDFLTYACYVQGKQKSGPLVYKLNISSSVTCLSLFADQNVRLNERVPYMEDMREMWWYWIKRDGEMQKIAYCNSDSCVFEECNTACPRCRPRLTFSGVTMVLTDVREEDRGLQFQCRLFPKIVGTMESDRTAQVYTIKISSVSSDSFSSTSLSKISGFSSKSTQMPSRTSSNSSARNYQTTQSRSTGGRGPFFALTTAMISWILF